MSSADTPLSPAAMLGDVARIDVDEDAVPAPRPARAGELLPRARLAGPMPWVIAIMVALTVIAAATGIALRNIAAEASAELSGGITVQIVEAGAEARAKQAAAALAVLRDTDGIYGVRLVPQQEVDRLIDPWLGGEKDNGAVPVPALIDAHAAGTITPDRLAAITSALQARAPAARVDAQASWLRPVFGAIASLQWLALALIALLAVAMAAAVLLATRTALGSHRGTIEIVHMLGATDVQVARIFQRAIGMDAAVGGVAGLALAFGVIAFVGDRFASLGAGMVEGGTLGLFDWVLLVLIPVAGVLLAMLTARLSVLRALRRML
jgi:cell division transport system permease protein